VPLDDFAFVVLLEKVGRGLDRQSKTRLIGEIFFAKVDDEAGALSPADASRRWQTLADAGRRWQTLADAKRRLSYPHLNYFSGRRRPPPVSGFRWFLETSYCRSILLARVGVHRWFLETSGNQKPDRMSVMSKISMPVGTNNFGTINWK
jgi:hypothetical protein